MAEGEEEGDEKWRREKGAGRNGREEGEEGEGGGRRITGIRRE